VLDEIVQARQFLFAGGQQHAQPDRVQHRAWAEAGPTMALAELQDRPASSEAAAPRLVLQAVRAIAQGPLRDAADSVDRGTVPA
jgi:hypothetical protein